MAKIIAEGVPEKYKALGKIKVTVEGTDVEIKNVKFEQEFKGEYVEADFLEEFFDQDMKEGPTYPLCADPETMRCALFVLYEWFGEDRSCWIEEPKHVKVEGEIEPMESEPGAIY